MDALWQIAVQIGWLNWVLLGLAVIAATVLRAFSGFGTALALVPLAAMVIPADQAVTLAAIVSVTASIRTVFTVQQDMDRHSMPWLVGGAALGLPLGIYVLTILPENMLRLAIGVTVMGSAVLLFRIKPVLRQLPRNMALATGMLSGMMSGSIAMPAPPITVWFLATQSNPVISRASMMVYFVLVNIMAIVGYAIAGVFGLTSLVNWLLMLPFIWIGDKLGFWLFNRYGGAWYRKAAIMLLFVIGLISLVRAV